jgi:hypothetical protein
MSLIQIELTESEQASLLGLFLHITNRIIAAGDPYNWLGDIESVEEKILAAQDDADIEHRRMPIIYDERSA